MALPAPNYTQYPNLLIDQAPRMPDSALRVSLAVARFTFGWHKRKDRISLSQLEKATGLSRQGVILGSNWLILHGYMEKTAIDPQELWQGFTYELLVSDGVVNAVDQSTTLTMLPNKHSQRGLLPEANGVVNAVDTQKKGEKEIKRRGKKKAEAAASATPKAPKTTASKTPKASKIKATTSPLKKSAAEVDVPPAKRKAMFDKLATLTNSTPAMCASQLMAMINKLLKAEATELQIDHFGLWWCQDWRSKGDAVPTIGQVGQLWGVAMAWADKHAPKAPPPPETLSPEDAAALEATMLAEMAARETELEKRRQEAGWVPA